MEEQQDDQSMDFDFYILKDGNRRKITKGAALAEEKELEEKEMFEERKTIAETKTTGSRKTLQGGRSIESRKTLLGRKIMESRKTLLDTKAMESRKTLVDTKAMESRKTLVDTKAMESRKTLVDTKAMESRKTLVERKTIESRKTLDADELTEAPSKFLELGKEYSETSQEPPTPLVLEPDHPMMERFQAALKNHLLKQLDRVSNQVFELDNEIKMKEKERELTGVDLYAMQQEMFKQQKTLEDCEAAIESLMKERQELDESVRNKKTTWKEEVNRLNVAKKKENDMMAEFHKLSTLEKQMEQWEKDMNAEISVSQRVSEKTQYDKTKLIEEKRKMDMYLLRLMTAVSNYESEIKLLDGEIEVKLEEKDLLNQTVADATADLQCLITEQKRLLSAWNSVVSTINQRNFIYNDISKELTKCQEGFRELNLEIESYKRSSAEEMKKGESLAIICGRLQTDKENVELVLNNLRNKKKVVEEKIVTLAAIIDKTETENQHYLVVNEKLESCLLLIKQNIDKIWQEKRSYEDKFMNYLQEQIFNDKTAAHLNKLLREEREKSRKLEFNLLETENKISHKFLEIEELKGRVSRNNEIILEINAELNAKKDELKKNDDEIAKCQTAIIQKQGNYAALLRKIEKFQEKNISEKPLEKRIVELEKMNAEIQAKNDKMQSLWLIHQNNHVKLTQQRNEQLKDLSLIRRQVLLLQHRGLKIDLEFEKEKKTESDVDKSICRLQHKLSTLNEILIGKKGYHQNLGKENTITQAQYLQNLKDAELEQIRLKAEIKDLETSLEELAEAMLEVQREMLAWEKKVTSAVEAKNDMLKERSVAGEIGQMRSEIHRMEVRFGQLKKVQDKLTSDLEHCILRRDAILEGADAMERRRSKAINTRMMIQRKIDSIRNNIRSLGNEQQQIENLIKNTEEGHEELRKVISDKEAQLVQMDKTTRKMDEELEEGKLRKCQNLEKLIRRQKKCKLYELVKKGKHRLLYKNEETIEKELQKAKNTNADLVSVVEALTENFPAYRTLLKKISNSLQAAPA